MGIADDIKPQKKTAEDIELKDKDITEEQTEDDSDQDVVEIPIDKSGKTPPVYEDIFPEHETYPANTEDDNIEKTNSTPSDSENQELSDQNDIPKKSNHWLTYVLIFVVIFTLVALGIIYFDKIRSYIGNKTSDNSSSEDDSGVEIINGQDYTRVSNDTDKDDSSKNTEIDNADDNKDSTVSNDTDNTSDNITSEPAQIDKSTIKLKVLNGNGISGSAAVLADILKTNGFVVESVTNASRFTYENTTIYFNTGKSAESELIKQSLTNYNVLSYENPSVTGNYDIIVVVGKK